MTLVVTARSESWPIEGAFTISRGSRTVSEVVVAELSDGTYRGWGECVPYARYGETVQGVCDAISGMAEAIDGGLDRAGLQQAMPPGAARNALDCAFWDLEAKRAGARAWELAGLPAPEPVVTAFTLSLETPDKMRAAAARNAHRPLLKIKLGGEGDLERLEAVRAGAPDARIIVDANEGWTAESYTELAPVMLRLGVSMVEQPLPADADEPLAGLDRPLPVCADEACHASDGLDKLAGRYDMINIKLDKTGGLTEALRLKAAGEARGLQVMVGCMLSTSLSMAPATLVAQGAAVVDLDGPLLLAKDRPGGLLFDDAGVHPPAAVLWG